MLASLKHAIVRLLELDVPVLAGGLAFFGVLSVFPSIGLALLVYGMVSAPSEAIPLGEATKQILPKDAHELISAELKTLVRWSGRQVSVGVVIAVGIVGWSAMAGWKALISGIRVVTGEQRRLTLVGYQFQSLLLSFLLVGAIVTAILAFVLALRVLSGDDGSGSRLVTTASVVRLELIVLAIASFGIYGSLLVIYRVSLSRVTATLAECSYGAAAGAIAWFVCIAVFDYYAESASWRSVYGTLAGAIAILLWFYVSSYTALFGAAYAAALGRSRRTAV